ncbi:MAG: bifunctional nuclease family protein [Desulfosarcinaceae bacterium]|nr:bifunctional nuclease family protein [Desulfosarcinaceae bacterium]
MRQKVSIAGLTIDPASNTPIILLKTDEGEETVPIWIGLLEATAIAAALQNIDFERPMTHDLFKNFVQTMEMEVVKIEVCDLKDNTFYALIYFASDEQVFTMDARPSDAIAIALRFDAPIYVDSAVIEKARVSEPKVEVHDKSSAGKKWAEYLNDLSPEDFGKYKM